MGLKVVGTGLGRTGTKSMQTALASLGFGPCHHMLEVFQHPESMQLWIDAADGQPNWDLIFKDYSSTLDYPSAAFWRELTDYYPDAKVLHTVRDPDEWFESVHATIFAPDGRLRREGNEVLERFFGCIRRRLPAQLDDRAGMTGFFRRHTEDVISAIAPERLLIYEMGEGWDRLCDFLGVAVPVEPYPSENSRAEFIRRTQSQHGERASR